MDRQQRKIRQSLNRVKAEDSGIPKKRDHESIVRTNCKVM